LASQGDSPCLGFLLQFLISLVKVHYVKAHAYRVKPLKKEGSLSIDGEAFPFEEFQVDVEKGLATFLSPYGHYAADFGPK
jgi:sphingosine kinase